MAIELRIPVREPDESDVDYIYRIGAAQREYNNRICHAIDRMSTKVTSPAKYDARKAFSVHDYLADRPDLLKRYKEKGIVALLEF